jgi:hypothetical protein
VEEVDAGACCGAGAHAFAGAPGGGALALTSAGRSVPLLLRGGGGGDAPAAAAAPSPPSALPSRGGPPSAGWHWASAGAHSAAVHAVDWHPAQPVVLSASADRSVHVSRLDPARLPR